MKKISAAIFLTILLCLNGCIQSRDNTDTDLLPEEGTTLIRIECRNEKYVILQTIQLLKAARLADLDFNKAGAMDDRVEARFRSLTKDKEQQLKQLIEQMDGVIHVEIIKDRMPTKNPFI
jgi:hypothetical protein